MPILNASGPTASPNSVKQALQSKVVREKQDDDDDQDYADEAVAAMALAVTGAAKRPLKPPSRKITSMITTISPSDMNALPFPGAKLNNSD